LEPYIFSDSHHPNPTQTERIYRAFLFAYQKTKALAVDEYVSPVRRKAYETNDYCFGGFH
jgi:hypothetical protein